MHAAGEAFLALETDPADADDAQTMQGILGNIETLIQAETAEPADDPAAAPQ